MRACLGKATLRDCVQALELTEKMIPSNSTNTDEALNVTANQAASFNLGGRA